MVVELRGKHFCLFARNTRQQSAREFIEHLLDLIAVKGKRLLESGNQALSGMFIGHKLELIGFIVFYRRIDRGRRKGSPKPG